CSEVLESIDTLELNTKQKAKRLIELCKEELSNPTFYDQHIICKELGISAQNMNLLIDSLLKEDFQASRTHFTGTSFKTNAKIDQIKSIVHSLDENT
ncbi:tRNA (guanine(10)-N(2))-dimethyltransferase, partial [Methanosalsum natronophilum]